MKLQANVTIQKTIHPCTLSPSLIVSVCPSVCPYVSLRLSVPVCVSPSVCHSVCLSLSLHLCMPPSVCPMSVSLCLSLRHIYYAIDTVAAFFSRRLGQCVFAHVCFYISQSVSPVVFLSSCLCCCHCSMVVSCVNLPPLCPPHRWVVDRDCQK